MRSESDSKANTSATAKEHELSSSCSPGLNSCFEGEKETTPPSRTDGLGTSSDRLGKKLVGDSPDTKECEDKSVLDAISQRYRGEESAAYNASRQLTRDAKQVECKTYASKDTGSSPLGSECLTEPMDATIEKDGIAAVLSNEDEAATATCEGDPATGIQRLRSRRSQSSAADHVSHPGAFALGGYRPAERLDPSESHADPRALDDEGENLGLVNASPVMGESDRDHWPHAVEVGEWGAQEQEKRPLIKAYSSWVIGFGLVAGLVLLLVFLMSDDAPLPTTKKPSASPSRSPSPTIESLVLSLLPEETLMALDNPASAQILAYNWTRHDPNLMNYSEQQIIQRFALATLYFATNGERWFANRDWLSYDKHECQWLSKMENNGNGTYDGEVAGIFNVKTYEPFYPCEGAHGDQTFVHLWLYNNNLQGQLPEEIYLLTSLKSIVLDANGGLGGSISTKVGTLSSLQILSIWTSDLAGELPSQIGLLTNLWEIGLSVNKVGGSIPTETGLLSNLANLMLAENQLTGPMPSQLGLLKSLGVYQLLRNALTGSIPTDVGLLTSLFRLNIRGNQLTGPIPSQLGLMKASKAFFVDDNAFTGVIPYELGDLPAVINFAVGNNQLTGTIPTEFGRMTGARMLLMHANELSGQVPTELGRATRMQRMRLHGNNLSGQVPSELGSLDTVWLLRLQGNRFTGALPSELGQATGLEVIDLSSNQLDGEIPSEFGMLYNLQSLSVAENALTGSIPWDLARLALNGSLVSLNLTGNAFAGNISSELCSIGNEMLLNAACPVSIVCGLHYDCSDDLHGCNCQ